MSENGSVLSRALETVRRILFGQPHSHAPESFAGVHSHPHEHVHDHGGGDEHPHFHDHPHEHDHPHDHEH